MSGVLEFRALGPLAVLRDGAPVELGKGNERTLIALLVLHADRPLSNDTIIDALWGEQPPPTAPEMVRNYVARVRKRLGEDAIATMPSGYRLVADPERGRLTAIRAPGQGGRSGAGIGQSGCGVAVAGGGACALVRTTAARAGLAGCGTRRDRAAGGAEAAGDRGPHGRGVDARAIGHARSRARAARA